MTNPICWQLEGSLLGTLLALARYECARCVLESWLGHQPACHVPHAHWLHALLPQPCHVRLMLLVLCNMQHKAHTRFHHVTLAGVLLQCDHSMVDHKTSHLQDCCQTAARGIQSHPGSVSAPSVHAQLADCQTWCCASASSLGFTQQQLWQQCFVLHEHCMRKRVVSPRKLRLLYDDAAGPRPPARQPSANTIPTTTTANAR